MALRNSLVKILLLALCFSAISGCKKDKCTQTVTYATYVPVYMSYADMRNGVKIGAAQPLKSPGKIYIKGNYLFVNELNSGIHVIDNTNPSSPQNIAFITIPGNVDMAVNGNTLYADSYIDLLSFNISSITNITLANRAQSALPYNCSSNGYYADSSQGVVIAWQKKMVTQKVNENCSGYGGSVGVVDPLMYNGATGLTTTGSSAATYGSSATPGVGGSTSRFTIAANTLYVVDYTALHVFDISNISPAHINDYNLGWSIETIFPFNNHLYIGSSSGFYIYDISNPQSPAYVSEYSHITACDPVVVDNHYAYFTLNSDYPCHKSVNELDVVDISNQQNPTLVTTVPMSSPRGLGVDAQTLFICDNKDGLKVYNTSDINNLQSNMVAHFSNINAFDVIPYNKHLVMTGSNGIYQYDYTNLQNITLLSSIPVSLN